MNVYPQVLDGSVRAAVEIGRRGIVQNCAVDRELPVRAAKTPDRLVKRCVSPTHIYIVARFQSETRTRVAFNQSTSREDGRGRPASHTGHAAIGVL